MKIGLHGGDCCGVKHISGLFYSPNTVLCAREKLARGKTSFGVNKFGPANNDMRRKNDFSDADFFNEKALKETAGRRLTRMVKFIKKHRPHGVIEVVISSYQCEWRPSLKRRGFKLVSEAVNSNTGSTIFVYHLVY